MATSTRVRAHIPADDNSRYFGALAAAARRLAGSLDRASIHRAVVNEVIRALDTDTATIRLVTPDGRLPVAAAAGIGPSLLRRMPQFSVEEAWFRQMSRTHRAWVRAEMEPEAGRPPGLRHRSSAVVPLVSDRDVIGVLSTEHRQPRAWERDEIAFLEAVAGQAVIALRNADLYGQSERWAAQLAVVQASMARMNRLTSSAEIGQAVVEETRRVIAYHNCRVYLLQPPDDLLPIAFKGEVGTYDDIPLEVLRTKTGVGFTGWAAAHGQALLINDANADPRGATIVGTEEVDESMVVVPMMFDDEVLGVVTLSKLGLDQFDERDLRLMQILADAAATAIQSGRGLDESRLATARMQRLLAMSSDLSRSLDPLAVAELIARHLGLAAGADETTISYWDRQHDRVVTWGRFPSRTGPDSDPDYQLDDYPLTRRALEEQVTVLLDTASPAADPAETSLLSPAGFTSLVMLPLVEAGRSIGLVEMTGREALHLDPATMDLVRAMGNEAAMMLENARLYEEARKLADRDPLTNFLNHRAFYERLGEELLRAQRSRQAVALLMIDLDGFKLVNDTRGHQIGDEVLRWTADRIRAAIRASDVPARYGGDEFAIILPDTDVDHGRNAAQRIIAAFNDDAFPAVNGASVPIGMSIGVAAFPADARTPGDLVGAADRALYRGKRAGGGSAVATSDLDEAA